MTESPFEVPTDVTFEQAIALTQACLQQIEQQEISEADCESMVSALVATENGARGFFVTYLTDQGSLADHPSSGILNALRSSPQVIADLLVKNLAMSTAMAITHRRTNQPDLAQSSEQVQSRSLHLIQLTRLPEIPPLVAALIHSTINDSGTYAQFLNRWGYDAEQRQAIQQAFRPILETLNQSSEKS